jgi:hypothetical protein
VRNCADYMMSVVVAVGPRKDQNAKLHRLKNIIRKPEKTAARIHPHRRSKS